MIDALGMPQSLLLVGGTSEIGLAIVAELEGRLQRVVLAGRDRSSLEKASAELNAEVIDLIDLELTDASTWVECVDKAFGDGAIDIMVLAAGLLGDNNADPALIAQVNYVAPMVIGMRAVEWMRKQGHGVLVVLSSVAAERPRADNYLYASSKVGLDAWANGLADSLIDSGVRVLVVRPGMVRTRMSVGSNEAPFMCEKQDVARAVAKYLMHGPTTIWVPWQLRYLMSGVRHLPRPVFRKVAAKRSR